MKKLLVLAVLTVSFFSCSNDSDNASIANSLREVVLFRNSPQELHWKFNTDGQLTEATNGQNQVVERYTYNNLNQITRVGLFTNGTETNSYTFTYDTNGIVASINGNAVVHNTATNTYTYTHNGTARSVTFNTDRKATQIVDMEGTASTGYTMTYQAGNLTSYTRTSMTSNVSRNYNYNTMMTYRTELGRYTAALAMVKSFIEPEFLAHAFTSQYVPEECHHGAPATLRYSYGVLPGERSLQFTSEEYVNDTPGTIASYQEYYYGN
ncbi:hypothetical protein [Flavobacterium sp.]|jgi:hypothetical protein|uniref:hypothetical protein n=1 Tax=Flavobacterium sp. TaxID=239 RepID=UPI0022C8D121|nr:hypothetical protein [Flavobacterium sp.]MCZ8143936.1 hypothetical protein [Flavobacterium sp.]MCZ8367314.1 hypothetical protein [Flavobacterium sp.]